MENYYNIQKHVKDAYFFFNLFNMEMYIHQIKLEKNSTKYIQGNTIKRKSQRKSRALKNTMKVPRYSS